MFIHLHPPFKVLSTHAAKFSLSKAPIAAWTDIEREISLFKYSVCKLFTPSPHALPHDDLIPFTQKSLEARSPGVKEPACMCAHAQVYVCVCVWRRTTDSAVSVSVVSGGVLPCRPACGLPKNGSWAWHVHLSCNVLWMQQNKKRVYSLTDNCKQ